MADLEKTVSIIFLGVDKIGDGIASAAGQFNKLDAAVGAIADPLAKVADSILKADAALAAMAAGGIALAIDQSGKFQASFNEIVTVSGATGNSVDKFKNDIISYSQDSTKSIADITDSVYRAISAGVSYTQSLDLLKVAEKLSVAGRAELKETTLSLVGTLNAYGAGTDQAAKYSDILFTAVKNGQTTLPELNQSLAMVTGLAANAKVPFETLAASIAALTASGLPTAQAVTGIKQALENIIKPSGEAEKMAASLGVQFNASALQTKGFDGVLKDVQKATGGSVDKMAQLFGSVEGLNAVLVLAADKNNKFKDTLEAMRVAAGATDAAYQIMAQNLDLATQKLKNNVSVVLIDIGDKILPGFAGDVNALSDVFKSAKFALDSGAFDPVFALLNDAGIKIEAVFKAIATNLPEAMKLVKFDDLIKSLQDLGGSIGEIWADVDISTPEGLAKAVQFVVDSITSLMTVTGGMVDAFRPMLDSVLNAIDSFNQLDTESKVASGGILGTAKVVADAGLAIAAAVVAISAAGVDLKGVFEIISGSLKTAWNSLQVMVEGTALALLVSIRQVMEGLNAVTFGSFETTISKLDGSIKAIQATMASDYGEAVEGILKVGQGFSDLGDSAGVAVDRIQGTKTALTTIPAKTETKIELTYEQALEAVQKVTKGLTDIPASKSVSIVGAADEPSFSTAKRKIDEYITTEKGVTVITIANSGKLAEAKKSIDDNIPAEKKLSIQADVDKERIKAQAAEIGSYFDFKAKVDVAQIEAAAKVTVAAFDSINTTLTVTGKSLDSLFGLWAKADTFDKSSISGWIDQQLALQKTAVENQSKLIEAQVKYLDARNNALNAGQALIEIKGDGLAPQLEAFMWKVLEAIQVRVAEEHAEFLLGIA